ncbi:uncharacterized protein LOC129590716 isoform X2 [Paramacrobiotus metropolitanus]|uniref:uncharacterized protein LOC129590716 isoform X2 n=1 Tax=Paramacrobiotus metropolitanus TaxID=2943436 RepID=UPI0024461456|nr:uncharacterized protein LOC129590716 isoform X2 [Paramacrobiotus metropolitanus]
MHWMERHTQLQHEEFGSNCTYRYTNICIGRGHFGAVYKATVINNRGVLDTFVACWGHRRPELPQQTVAVKQIILSDRELSANPIYVDILRHKLKLLIGLHHENLITYHKITITPSKVSKGGATIELMMDYVEGDDLASYLDNLEKRRSTFKLETLLRYSIELADGISFLHRKEIVHKDLKPKIVLLERLNNDEYSYKLKISGLDDFAKSRNDATCSVDLGGSLTVRYMSPETLEMFDRETREMPGPKGDVWSLGCIILDLACCFTKNYGKLLFYSDTKGVRESGDNISDKRYRELIKAGHVPFVSDDVPADLAVFMRRCLLPKHKVQQRPSAKEVYIELKKIYDRHAKDTKSRVFGTKLKCRYGNGDFIGRGSCGTVYKATVAERNSFNGDDIVAVKVVPISSKQFPTKESYKTLYAKLEKLLELRHPNVVAYHKITVTEALGGVCIEIVMDYYRDEDLGSVLQMLRAVGAALDKETVVRYMKELTSGLNFLHEKDMIHGDLKPGNVLVKHVSGNRKSLLIGDLDDFVVTQQEEMSSGPITHLRGTPWYMSPEMLKKFAQQPTEPLGRKTDVWSLGCIMLQLANCHAGISRMSLKHNDTVLDTTDKTPEQYQILIIDGDIPHVDASVPSDLANFIVPCFGVPSTVRISARNLMEMFPG